MKVTNNIRYNLFKYFEARDNIKILERSADRWSNEAEKCGMIDDLDCLCNYYNFDLKTHRNIEDFLDYYERMVLSHLSRQNPLIYFPKRKDEKGLDIEEREQCLGFHIPVSEVENPLSLLISPKDVDAFTDTILLPYKLIMKSSFEEQWEEFKVDNQFLGRPKPQKILLVGFGATEGIVVRRRNVEQGYGIPYAFVYSIDRKELADFATDYYKGRNIKKMHNFYTQYIS